MKSLRFLLLLVLLTASAFGTTVTGTIQDANGNPYANGTASAVSVVASGQASVSTTPVTTNGAGFFTLTLNPGTYIITVCAAPTQIGPLANPTPKQVCAVSGPIAISGGSQDVSTTLNAVAPTLGPSLSSIQGANNNFTGNNGHSGLETFSGGLTSTSTTTLSGPISATGTDSGNQTISGNKSFTGSNTFKNLNNIRFADQFAGADCGAKINAADADLGGNPGEIWVNPNCGTNWTTAITINSQHRLKILEGNIYLLSQPLTMTGNGVVMEGAPKANTSVGTQQVVLKAANSANLAEVVIIQGNSGAFIDDVISNVVIDGNRANNGATYGVYINNHNRVSILSVAIQNAVSHGLYIFSDTAAHDYACCGKIIHSMFDSNGGSGIYSTNTTDWWLTASEVENNGRHGIEKADSGGWLIEDDDISGNLLDGINSSGTLANTDLSTTITGDHFGNNCRSDINIQGWTGSVNSGGGNVIANNQLQASHGAPSPGCTAGRADNTYAQIFLVDTFGGDSITGNTCIIDSLGNRPKWCINTIGTSHQGVVTIVGNNLLSTSAYGAGGAFLTYASNALLGVNAQQGMSGLAEAPGGIILMPNNVCLDWLTAGGAQDCVLFEDSSNGINLKAPTSNTINLQTSGGTVAQVFSGQFQVTSGNVTILGGHLNQTATAKFAGTCVFAAGTTCAITYGSAFSSTPVVLLQPVNPGAVTFTLTSTSNSGFTITASGSNSLTVNWEAIGNPN